MKKILIITAALALSISAGFAQQKLAYVNSEYVLKHIPEYAAAQKQLDDLSTKWQEEVDAKFEEIERLYKAYQNDQTLLNDDMRRRREDEIVNKEREVKDLQRKRFGFEGELFKQRSQLIQPIQQRLTKAIQDIAAAESLDLILDRSTEATFLFANPALDKSNAVITKLGFKPDPKLAD
ncbi:MULTISPECIES: OmpH family outer membrane protein [Sphingobacterium]|uniref:OmpH family outer membrane protein n=1 Tax=Sphingobacterium populi TaxID=1812824 RepID=A0ABW5U810_9SPHI|nr:OmpH family outer membrane protein [Sphingobacterium sp. CFCC 11742]